MVNYLTFELQVLFELNSGISTVYSMLGLNELTYHYFTVSAAIVLSTVVQFKKLLVLLTEPLGGLLLIPSPPLPPRKSDRALIPLHGQWRAVCAAELLWKQLCTESFSPGAAEAQLSISPSQQFCLLHCPLAARAPKIPSCYLFPAGSTRSSAGMGNRGPGSPDVSAAYSWGGLGKSHHLSLHL